jgi:SpoIIAA-like
MIEFLPRSHDNVLAIKVGGTLTAKDYETELIPRLDEAMSKHDVVHLMFAMDPSFSGWTLNAAWEDARLGLTRRSHLGRIAVVGGPQWVSWCMAAGAFMMKGEMRSFPYEELEAAWDWVNSSPSQSV